MASVGGGFLRVWPLSWKNRSPAAAARSAKTAGTGSLIPWAMAAGRASPRCESDERSSTRDAAVRNPAATPSTRPRLRGHQVFACGAALADQRPAPRLDPAAEGFGEPAQFLGVAGAVVSLGERPRTARAGRSSRPSSCGYATTSSRRPAFCASSARRSQARGVAGLLRGQGLQLPAFDWSSPIRSASQQRSRRTSAGDEPARRQMGECRARPRRVLHRPGAIEPSRPDRRVARAGVRGRRRASASPVEIAQPDREIGLAQPDPVILRVAALAGPA